jgi:hypothetical protein
MARQPAPSGDDPQPTRHSAYPPFVPLG